MRVVVLLVVAWGCATLLPTFMHWPDRGAAIVLRNWTATPLQFGAQDGMGREFGWRQLKPGGSVCLRWPFVDKEYGRLWATVPASGDTVWSAPFHPWDHQAWIWEGDVDEPPRQLSEPCRQ